jgi:hypothetical protein
MVLTRVLPSGCLAEHVSTYAQTDPSLLSSTFQAANFTRQSIYPTHITHFCFSPHAIQYLQSNLSCHGRENGLICAYDRTESDGLLILWNKFSPSARTVYCPTCYLPSKRFGWIRNLALNIPLRRSFFDILTSGPDLHVNQVATFKLYTTLPGLHHQYHTWKVLYNRR